MVTHTDRADFYDMEHAGRLGGLLPSASARALEKVLAVNPDDLLNRARLLGYYWKRCSEEPGKEPDTEPDQEQDKEPGKEPDTVFQEARANHILWFVENAPDCVFAGDYYLSVDKDDLCYKKIRRAWLDQVRSNPGSAQLLVNTALFLFKPEPEEAARILHRVLEIEPLNEWALALLDRLGHTVGHTLPLPVDSGPDPDPSELEVRVRSVARILRLHAFRARIPRATCSTQERILAFDPLDLWARLDLLRWCGRNIERANQLGFDPTAAQCFYRHVLWFLRHLPSIYLGEHGLNSIFETKLPSPYHEPMKRAFIEALSVSMNKELTIRYAIMFFLENQGSEETRKFIYKLDAWKDLDQKTRRRLRREINWESRLVSVFDKNIDLESLAVYVDAEVESPPVFPSRESLWANDLELGIAWYEGRSYPPQSAANLYRVLQDYQCDLVSTIRLRSYYSRIRSEARDSEMPLPEEVLKMLQDITVWVVRNLPESFLASHSCYSGGSDSIGAFRLAWEEQVSGNKGNNLLAINASSAMASFDRSMALSLATSVLESDPENIVAREQAHFLSYHLREDKRLFRDHDFERECEDWISTFRSEADPRLAAVCDEIGLYRYSFLDCLEIPERTAWSNEQALKLVPNDLILRAEIWGFCNRVLMEREHRMPPTANPEVLRLLTRQLLWFLENAPGADLYFLLQTYGLFGHSGHEKILDKAVKRQRKVFGKSVAKYRPEFPKKKKSPGA